MLIQTIANFSMCASTDWNQDVMDVNWVKLSMMLPNVVNGPAKFLNGKIEFNYCSCYFVSYFFVFLQTNDDFCVRVFAVRIGTRAS